MNAPIQQDLEPLLSRHGSTRNDDTSSMLRAIDAKVSSNDCGLVPVCLYPPNNIKEALFLYE